MLKDPSLRAIAWQRFDRIVGDKHVEDCQVATLLAITCMKQSSPDA